MGAEYGSGVKGGSGVIKSGAVGYFLLRNSCGCGVV